MVAICSMVKNPFNFETWINYHFSLGIKYIFLRIEDTPELIEIVEKYSNIFANFVEKKDDSLSQMDRQALFIESQKGKMISIGIDWVLHIDCDELFCANNLDIFNEVDDRFDVLHFNNYEAIYDSDNLSNPFLQTNKFKIKNRLSYGNGKSAARVNDNLKPIKCHYFEGKRLEVSPKKAVILHFESPTFEYWHQKFIDKKWVGNVDIKKQGIEKIPFDFYKKSIELINSNNLEKAREYYNSMKVNIEEDIKLTWTPLLENKNIHWA